MKKRTARTLRRIANHLDPAPQRWYAASWQQSASTRPFGEMYYTAAKPKRKRVLADYLTPMDLKKLRP